MVLGTYKEAISARSTDSKILEVSQDGGIVSALLCYALDEGIIEGAVVAGTPDEDWRPHLMKLSLQQVLNIQCLLPYLL